ncbi:MAG: hypothetical protein WAM61_01680 [Desulfobacterales bacterium]
MHTSEKVKPTGAPGDSAQQKSALLVATVTSFMGPFMISSVNVALPAIQAEFAVDAVMLAWISTAYLLATATVIFAVFIGRSPITPANCDLFLRCVRITFAVFTVLCAAGVFFSMMRGRIRAGEEQAARAGRGGNRR